jgi:carotenoid cleavage dioxygenase-like enzyme
MIHKFSFANGKVGYANRYVRGTAFVENERAGRITAQTFATDLGEPMGAESLRADDSCHLRP